VTRSAGEGVELAGFDVVVYVVIEHKGDPFEFVEGSRHNAAAAAAAQLGLHFAGKLKGNERVEREKRGQEKLFDGYI